MASDAQLTAVILKLRRRALDLAAGGFQKAEIARLLDLEKRSVSKLLSGEKKLTNKDTNKIRKLYKCTDISEHERGDVIRRGEKSHRNSAGVEFPKFSAEEAVTENCSEADLPASRLPTPLNTPLATHRTTARFNDGKKPDEDDMVSSARRLMIGRPAPQHEVALGGHIRKMFPETSDSSDSDDCMGVSDGLLLRTASSSPHTSPAVSRQRLRNLSISTGHGRPSRLTNAKF